MKRFILGAMLFVSGFAGVLLLVCISIFEPCIYNGIGGFRGFLLSTDTEMFFVLFCILSILGIALCSIEAYRKSSNKG